jgi:hypothetical protein
VIDELGYIPFSAEAADLMFHFVSSRHEAGSTIVTTNLDFSRWTEIFGEEGLTAAVIDRLVHRAHIIATNGDSFRFKESLRRKETEACEPIPGGALFRGRTGAFRDGHFQANTQILLQLTVGSLLKHWGHVAAVEKSVAIRSATGLLLASSSE